MTDTKTDRDKQADDEERRQREREREEARDRADEAEPPRDDPGEQLGDLDAALDTHEYPTTTHEVIEAYGDHAVESQGGWRSIGEVLAPLDDETYDSADDVRHRIQQLLNPG
jgi:hypothetical protein